jgi:hypothetical protein
VPVGGQKKRKKKTYCGRLSDMFELKSHQKEKENQ